MKDLVDKKERHRCSGSCVCPDHGLQLLYSPAFNLHACRKPTCRLASGFELDIMTAARLMEARQPEV